MAISEDLQKLKKIEVNEKRAFEYIKERKEQDKLYNIKIPDQITDQVLEDLKNVLEMVENFSENFSSDANGLFYDYFLVNNLIEHYSEIDGKIQTDLDKLLEALRGLTEEDFVKANREPSDYEREKTSEFLSAIRKVLNLQNLLNEDLYDLKNDLEKQMAIEIERKISKGIEICSSRPTIMIERSAIEEYLQKMIRIAAYERRETGGFFRYKVIRNNSTIDKIYLDSFFWEKNALKNLDIKELHSKEELIQVLHADLGFGEKTINDFIEGKNIDELKEILKEMRDHSGYALSGEVERMMKKLRNKENFLSTHCHPLHDSKFYTDEAVLSGNDLQQLSESGSIIDEYI